MPLRPLRRYRDASRGFSLAHHVVDGVRVAVRRAGTTHTGSPCVVVMIPGLGLSSSYLLPLGAALARHVQVIAVDPPGFGRSGRPAAVLDVPAMGRFVVDLVTALGLGSVVLYGNSMGCQVAVEAAASGDRRIIGVVLDAPTIDARARSVVRHVGRIARDALHEPLSLWMLQARDWTRAGPRRLVATTRHTFRHEMAERLADVTCPSLVVRGSRDTIVPQRWADEVCATLPHGALVTVEGGTHAMPYRDPLLLDGPIIEFVDGLERLGSP